MGGAVRDGAGNSMSDEMRVGVQVSCGLPGAVPVAFLAVVEVIDPNGERYYEVVTSVALTEERKKHLLDNIAL